MKLPWRLILIALALAVASPCGAQVRLKSGSPIRDFVSPVEMEVPLDLLRQPEWTTREFSAYICENMYIDRLTVSREYNSKRTEVTIRFEIKVKNKVGRPKKARLSFQLLSDQGPLSIRKGKVSADSHEARIRVDGQKVGTEWLTVRVAAADFERFYGGANPRMVVKLTVPEV